MPSLVSTHPSTRGLGVQLDAPYRPSSARLIAASSARDPAPAPPLPARPAALPLALAAAALSLAAAEPAAALALDIHMEPANALSLPTWAVHTSSVIEWLAGMALMWRYAEVSGNERFKGMTWGMLPCLGSAMCACTWHFFYNAPELDFLVTLQAALTVVGNFSCWAAAYRIYEGAKEAGKV